MIDSRRYPPDMLDVARPGRLQVIGVNQDLPTRGIGLEFARGIAEHGAEIWAEIRVPGQHVPIPKAIIAAFQHQTQTLLVVPQGHVRAACPSFGAPLTDLDGKIVYAI